jgi:hypothetical protein
MKSVHARSSCNSNSQSHRHVISQLNSMTYVIHLMRVESIGKLCEQAACNFRGTTRMKDADDYLLNSTTL